MSAKVIWPVADMLSMPRDSTFVRFFKWVVFKKKSCDRSLRHPRMCFGKSIKVMNLSSSFFQGTVKDYSSRGRYIMKKGRGRYFSLSFGQIVDFFVEFFAGRSYSYDFRG